MQIEVASNTARSAWGSAGPIALVLWRDINVDDLHAFTAYAEALAARSPAGYAVVSFAGAKLKPPPPDVRAAIVKLTAAARPPHYKGSTTCVLGHGFFATVARAALAGLSLAGGKSVPDHVSSNADEAARFLAPRVGLDVEETAARFHEFLAAASAAPPQP